MPDGCTYQPDLFAAPKKNCEQDRVQDLVSRGALFVVNHSGGKDSQCMLIKLRQIVPDDQLLITLAHYDSDWTLLNVKSRKVGKGGLRPDTWYTRDDDGKFVECDDD